MALVIELGCNEGSGDALDTSGNGNHANNSQGGTWGGVGTGYYAGGNSLQTSGTGNNRWIVPFNASWAGMRTAYSFTCWYNRTSGSSWQTVMGHANSGNSDHSFSLYGYAAFAIYHADDPVSGSDGPTGWQHLASTFNGTAAVLYRNGVVIAQSSNFSSPSDPGSTQPLHLGGNGIWAGETLGGGYLDQIRCYDHAITLQDVIDDMNTEIGSGSPILVVPDSRVSLSAVESVAVTSDAPVTLDTGNVLPAITGATATVNSDSDEGLIYCAVRPVAFGPYGAGDEEAIKNGTDATWYANGGQTPVIGINTFLPTGLSEATDYHCGFAQETVSGAVYEHDFNAALGGFTYTRSGAAWGFRHDGYIEQVAENVPVYFKCDYSGSAFTPHVDYQGLTLSKGSTNTLIRNGGGQNDVLDYWTYLDLTLGTSFTIGSVWMVPLTTTATVASCDRGADGTTYEGPWVWTAFVAEGTAAGFSVEISASRGTAHYAWVGGVPVLQSVEDGCRSWSYHCGGGLWAVALIIPTTTNIWKAVHFYPARKDAWQTGVTTYFFGGTLVDQGYPGSEISPVLGATVTTAASFAHQTFADMGLSETSHDFTVFMRMQLFFDDTVDAAGPYLWTAAVKNTTSQQDRITLRVSGGKTYNYLILERRVGGGSATYETFTSAGLDVGTVYNIFISYDSAGDIIMRVDDSSTVKSGAGLVLDAPRGHLMLGRRHLTDTVPAPGPMAIRNLKVWDYALTDAEMDDIHNAYP